MFLAKNGGGEITEDEAREHLAHMTTEEWALLFWYALGIDPWDSLKPTEEGPTK